MQTTITCTLVLLSVLTSVNCIFSRPLPEDAKLNFTGLCLKYGHQVEEHEVVTEDGYILQLFRIPGKRRKPILLMHGLGDSSDTFIIRGNTSIAIVLADAGYDVWAGNIRGNRYSRRHVKLTDKDFEYWNFSFNECGNYDLPAAIDYVLQTTGKKKILSIGHSQGTTMHFVLLSKKPEYNEKISLFIALSPVAFLTDMVQPMATIALFRPVIDDFLKTLGQEELFNYNSTVSSVTRLLCGQDSWSYALCMRAGMFQMLGADSRRFEPSFLRTLVGHYPGITSRKSLVHYGQLITSKRFCEFDFGDEENLRRYGFLVPPDYNLYNIRANVALFVGRNDPLARIKDVEILRTFLPNVVHYHVMKAKAWNHLDFVWSNDMKVTLFPLIFNLLDKYN